MYTTDMGQGVYVVPLFLLTVKLCCCLPDVYRLSGKPAGGYYIQLDIGTPPQTLELLVDTGSSNLAIASYNEPYISKYFDSSKSTTFKSQGHSIQVNYTQGSWKGIVGSDVIKFSGGSLSAVKASVSLIQNSENFFENGTYWQGILGLGYQKIAVTPDDDKPTLLIDALAHSKQVPNGFSMQLCGPEDGPLADDIATGGNFTLGDIDPNQYSGHLYEVVVVRDGYYQLLITDIKVGGESLGMNCVEYNTQKTILDSGTTNLRLPTNVYSKFIEQLKLQANATNLDDAFWTGINSACIPHGENAASFYGQFPMVELRLLGHNQKEVTLVVSPQQYLRPIRSPSSPITDCYKVSVASSTTGSVIGAVVMEGYFVYFDRENSSVFFAETTCQPRVPDAQRSEVHGYSPASNTSICMYVQPPSSRSLPTYAVVLIVVFTCLLVLFISFLIAKLISRFRRQKQQAQSDIDFHNLVDNSFDTEY